MVKPRSWVAVIPARIGSKRIPKKNIVDFMGKPMICWTIEAALASRLFERVFVSTDSEEIAQIARQSGAEVPFLREHYNDDHAPISVVTQDFLSRYYANAAEAEPTHVCQLMANCPLRTAQDIQLAVEHFQQRALSFQLSCFKLGWMNPWWSVCLDAEGVPTPVFPEQQMKRSQDLPSLYNPTGAIWLASYVEFMREGTFYGAGYRFFPMPWQRAIDIDDQDDLAMAKQLFLQVKTSRGVDSVSTSGVTPIVVERSSEEC